MIIIIVEKYWRRVDRMVKCIVCVCNGQYAVDMVFVFKITRSNMRERCRRYVMWASDMTLSHTGH